MNNNTYAGIVAENRYIAGNQLIAAEFSSKEWKNYRQLCKVMVDESLKVYHNSSDMKNFDLAVVGLFSMFGMNDATKGIFKYRIRLAMACLQMKKEYSVPYKNARKALSDAKKARDVAEDAITEDMTEETNPVEFQALATSTAKVEECENTLETLASEPHNVWWNVRKLSSKNDKELAIARKHIEDTIADIIFERSNMTEEDKAIEKGQLDGGRKVAAELKAQA
jgi:hypothetical protein